MTESVTSLGITEAPTADGARPSIDLPIGALVRISAFWLGLTSIDAVVNATVQARLEFDNIVTPGTEGMALAFIAVVTFAFSVAVQPTVGSISDYTTSRWGRRKPYIVVGALLDVVFLIGIATANSLLAITAFVTLLQFSTNTARGAFQGYVPDLVPDRQVGLASAMVGLMQVFGNVLGFALAAIATEPGQMSASPSFAIAVVEVVTMLSVVLRVPKGPPAKPREGRSWVQIAAETWGTDILREKSYMWLLASRLFILMGGASLVNFVIFYLRRSQGVVEGDIDTAVLQLLAAATLAALVSIIPASRLSDRIGRKPVIYGCTAIGHRGPRDDRPRPEPQRGNDRYRAHRGVAGDVPVGRLGADDRHHPEGRVGAVHGSVERRHGLLDDDRGRDRRPDDGRGRPGGRHRRRPADRDAPRDHLLHPWGAGTSSGRRTTEGTPGRGYARSPRNSLTRRSTARGDRNDSSCHDDGRSKRNGSGWRYSQGTNAHRKTR